eukprot:480608-Prymnesium_polylepis.1
MAGGSLRAASRTCGPCWTWRRSPPYAAATRTTPCRIHTVVSSGSRSSGAPRLRVGRTRPNCRVG